MVERSDFRAGPVAADRARASVLGRLAAPRCDDEPDHDRVVPYVDSWVRWVRDSATCLSACESCRVNEEQRPSERQAEADFDALMTATARAVLTADGSAYDSITEAAQAFTAEPVFSHAAHSGAAYAMWMSLTDLVSWSGDLARFENRARAAAREWLNVTDDPAAREAFFLRWAPEAPSLGLAPQKWTHSCPVRFRRPLRPAEALRPGNGSLGATSQKRIPCCEIGAVSAAVRVRKGSSSAVVALAGPDRGSC